MTGKDGPYVIRPVEETVPADSKVSVTYDPETEAYIMRNEYVKLSVGEAEGTVDEIIRYRRIMEIMKMADIIFWDHLQVIIFSIIL